MPTKPKKAASLDTMTSIDILNATRNEAGGTYADAIPEVIKPGQRLANGRIATDQDAIMSLRSIGDIMMQYVPLQNAFLSALVNRIGRVMITSRLYENPLRGFKKGLMENGETVEEIFVGLAKPYQFDPVKAESRVFKRRLPDVEAAFHSMNFQKFYPQTVSSAELRQAFLSMSGVTDLIGRIIEQVYTAANYDELLVMKYLIARTALNGYIYPISIPEVTADNARDVTATMVKTAKDLTEMNRNYNAAGVLTTTQTRDLHMILTNAVSTIFDVEVLALSFNESRASLLGRQMSFASFGDIDKERLALIFADDPYTDYVPFTETEENALNAISGLMIDESWMMVFDNYINMTEIYNPEGLYWNYFYHKWSTFSVSPFSNAILFTEQTPSVSSVAVSPGTASVTRGQTAQFTANVTTTGFAPKRVTWTLTGASAVTSTISENGLLTVSADEANTTLTITATSTYDDTKTATATVTIS